MTTSKKVLSVIAAVVIIALVVLVVLAKVLVTPERVKGVLLPRVEQALNRQVSIEEIDISLFSGIALKKIAIMEAQEDKVFVAAEEINLRYRFWPLLRMRVEIDEIALESPQIRLVRLADGSFNFTDLTRLASKEKETEPPEESSTATDADDGDGIDLLISQLTIRNGTVRVLDYQAAEAPSRFQVDDLALQVSQFALDRDFPLRLSAILNDAPLSVEGTTNLGDGSANVKLGLTGLDVLPFEPYFREYLPGRLQGARIDLDVALSGDRKQLSSEGRVSFLDLDLELEALPKTPLQNVQITVDHNIQFDQAGRKLIIEHGTLAFNEVPISLAGEVLLAENTALDLNLRLNELDLAKTIAALPAGLVKDLVAFEPSGEITARLHLVGTPENPKELLHDGEFRLDGVQASVGTLRPALKGLIAIRGDSLFSENLVLTVGDSQLYLDCEAHSLMEMPVVAVANIRSDRLSLDSLLPDKSSTPGATSKDSPAAAPSPQQEKPLDLPITLSGRASIKQVLYRGLNIDDFQARYSLKNNVFQLQEMTGQVAGGSFTNTLTVDLGRPGYTYQAQLVTQGVQTDPLVTAFVPKAAGTLFGLLNLDLDLQGAGTEWKSVRRKLTGKGELALQEGRLTGSNLVKELADFLGLSELSVMGFDRASGRFAINNGRVDLTSTMTSQDVRLAPEGDVGLDGTLDLGLDLRLSPDLTKKLDGSGRFSQLLVDADGWGQVPLKIRGSVVQPSFALDSAMLKDALKEKAGQKLQETLEKKLFKNDPTTDEEDPDQKEKKLLEGVFKGIFGQ